MTVSAVDICSQKPMRFPKRNSSTASAPAGRGGMSVEYWVLAPIHAISDRIVSYSLVSPDVTLETSCRTCAYCCGSCTYLASAAAVGAGAARSSAAVGCDTEESTL